MSAAEGSAGTARSNATGADSTAGGILFAIMGHVVDWLATVSPLNFWEQERGTVLGIVGILLGSVLLWACALGFSLVAARLIVRRSASGSDRMPFGPGLALGIWLTWLIGPLGL